MFASGLLSEDLKPGTSLFSSVLPFGRADFGPSVFYAGQKLDIASGGVTSGSTGFLYLLNFASTPSAKKSVAAAGAAQLRIIPRTGNFPFYPYLPQRQAAASSLPGFYAGNDWLTLLDACALGGALALLRPFWILARSSFLLATPFSVPSSTKRKPATTGSPAAQHPQLSSSAFL